MKYFFICLILCSWTLTVQSNLLDFSQLSHYLTEEDLLIEAIPLMGKAQNGGTNFYDLPDQSPGNYWYVEKLSICKSIDQRMRNFADKIQHIRISIRNSKTNERKFLDNHGSQNIGTFQLNLANQGRCQAIEISSPENCINKYQISLDQGILKSLKFWYNKGEKTKTFGSGGTLQHPISLGNKCISGIYGQFSKQINLGFFGGIPPILQQIGFYYNEVYQNRQIVQLTGSWVLKGSGENISNGLSKSIVNSKGESQSTSTTSGYSIGKSVSVSFSFAGVGAQTSITSTTSQSQSSIREVNSQLQEGIEENCDNTCKSRNKKRNNVFQWVWDISTGNKIDNLSANTCHYVCNTNLNKPPVCEPRSCKNKQCTKCIK